MSLSERVRSGSEAAPWVVDEIVALESQRDRLGESLSELVHAIANMPPYSVAQLTVGVDKAYFGAVKLLQEVGNG